MCKRKRDRVLDLAREEFDWEIVAIQRGGNSSLKLP